MGTAEFTPEWLAEKQVFGFTASTLASMRQHYLVDGVFVIRKAIPDQLADCIRNEICSIDEHSNHVGNMKGLTVSPSNAHQNSNKFRFKDLYVNSRLVRDACFHPLLVHTLSAMTGKPLIAFMGQCFTRGSEISLHRDTNFMDFNTDQDLIACWIALEDVTPGSGELVYYPRSHTLPIYYYAEGKHRWNKQRDGVYANQRYSQWLKEQLCLNGMKEQSFLARKGDCIIWHGSLAHAGSPILNPAASRYCLVTHFCSHDNKPLYLNASSEQDILHHDASCNFCSRHYALGAYQSSFELDGNPIHPKHLDG